MSEKSKTRGLGRGLSALMADVQPAAPKAADVLRGDKAVATDRLYANPDQPRRTFDEADLADLVSSVKAKGIIQPLIVRAHPSIDDAFEIVAGERRWRAAQQAQLHEVPVIVREFSDTEVLEVAIIENVQRADLNPVEEAQGYRNLIDQFGHTQEQIAGALGKSRSYIANLMRLLQLPEDVLMLVKSGALSSGHARALITQDNPSELAALVVQKGLSVRETERLVQAKANAPGRKATRSSGRAEKDADTVALERDLSAAIGLKIAIDHKTGAEAGKLTISYSNLAQLDDLCALLSKERM